MSLFLVNLSTWGAVAVEPSASILLLNSESVADDETQSFRVYLSYYLNTSHCPDASELEFAFIGGFSFAFAMIAAPNVPWSQHSPTALAKS